MKKQLLFITIIVSFIATSCSSVYLPNVPATPMFTQQGEAYIAAHINPKGNASGNVAVAVGNHVAVLVNGSYIDDKQGNREFKQYMYEGGVGYFTSVGKKKNQILEIYGGYGVGQTRDADTRATTTGMEAVELRELDFDKIFVQFNYTTRKEKVKLFGKERQFNYGTAIRASRVKMTDFKLDGLESTREENLFIEPVFYTRMELSKGFQLQYTNGFNFGLVDNEYLKAGNAVFTLGLIYKFGGNKKSIPLRKK